jgi:hypothetical protein
MKNIHLIPTDKPSRLKQNKITKKYSLVTKGIDLTSYIPVNIYITNDEKPKEGDWHYNSINNTVYQKKLDYISFAYEHKIILTTDQELIKDDVQEIEEEFLEWFVKNPSCEFVDVYNDKSVGYEYDHYSIIIPKEEPKQRLEKYSERFDNDKSVIGNPDTWGKRIIEEPKQETLEEAVNTFKKTDVYINEIKQKQERMYSEEEIKLIEGLINLYWTEHNSEHPANLKVFELSKSILEKLKNK